MKPDRLAVFSYAHVPWVKPARNPGAATASPRRRTKLQVLKLVIEKLTANNQYVYIGMDHFARPSDELAMAQRNKQLQRNFRATARAPVRTSTRSVCRASRRFRKPTGRTRRNCRNGRRPWCRPGAAPARVFPDDEDKIRRETIMRVMCDLSLDYAAMSQKLGINFANTSPRNSRRSLRLKQTAWCAGTPAGLEVTDTGRLSSATSRCALTHPRPVAERKHSKTIDF